MKREKEIEQWGVLLYPKSMCTIPMWCYPRKIRRQRKRAKRTSGIRMAGRSAPKRRHRAMRSVSRISVTTAVHCRRGSLDILTERPLSNRATTSNEINPCGCIEWNAQKNGTKIQEMQLKPGEEKSEALKLGEYHSGSPDPNVFPLHNQYLSLSVIRKVLCTWRDDVSLAIIYPRVYLTTRSQKSKPIDHSF